MFFSKSSDISNLRMYLTLLNQLVNEGKEEYKDLFNEIIKISHELSSKKISHYSVKPELYDIVRFLTENNQSYFSDLNAENITAENYKSILAFFRSSISSKQDQSFYSIKS